MLATAKAKMEPYEWAFWMEGKPAEKDIKAPDGTLLEKAGAKRDGGSYDDRMGNVACWNAVMDENDYMVRKVERVHRRVMHRASARMLPSPMRGAVAGGGAKPRRAPSSRPHR